MAFVLRLISGNSNIPGVDFVNSPPTGCKLEDGGFILSYPERKQNWMPGGVGSDGLRLVESDFENRTAEIRFTIYAAALTDMEDLVEQIEANIRVAVNRQVNGYGPRVELRVKLEGVADNRVTYFEVYDGYVEWPEDWWSVGQVVQNPGPGGVMMISGFVLHLTLSPFGYGVSPVNGSPVQLPLYNPTVGSKTLNGLLVHHPFGGANRYSYVEIDGADIEGNAAGMLVLEVRRNYPKAAFATYDPLSELWVGHSIMYDPANYDNHPLIREFETMILNNSGSDGFTYQVLSNNSSASPVGARQYLRVNLSGSYTPRMWLTSLGLNPDMKGKFQVFAHSLSAFPTTASFGIYSPSYEELQRVYMRSASEPVFYSAMALNIGVLNMPAHNIPATENMVQHELRVVGQITTPGTPSQVDMDFLYLMPCDAGLRVYRTHEDVNDDQNAIYYDNPWAGQTYVRTPNANSDLDLRVQGTMEPIRLEPRYKQRLYFNFGNHSTDNAESGSIVVRAFYIPTFTMLRR